MASVIPFCFAFICYFVLSLFAISTPIPDGLLPNGDFSQPPTLGNETERIIASLPGWKIEGRVEYVSGGPQPEDFYFNTDSHSVRLRSRASISQTVVIKHGYVYALTFSLTRSCTQVREIIRLTVNGESTDFPIQTIYNGRGGDTYAWAFTAGSQSGHAALNFSNPLVKYESICGPLVNAVAIKELSYRDNNTGNLVTNGGFEDTPYLFQNYTAGTLLSTKRNDTVSPLPGWIIQSKRPLRLVDSAHFFVSSGRAALLLGEGKESAIAQDVETKPGKLYALSFTVGGAVDGCHVSMAVIAVAGNQTATLPYDPYTEGKSKSGGLKFKASYNTTRITFLSTFSKKENPDSTDMCGPALDDVRVYPV